MKGLILGVLLGLVTVIYGQYAMYPFAPNYASVLATKPIVKDTWEPLRMAMFHLMGNKTAGGPYAGQTCLTITARMVFQVQYPMTGQGNKMSGWKPLNISKFATVNNVSSSCMYMNNPNYQLLVINLMKDKDWRLSMMFTNDTAVTGRKDGSMFIMNAMSLSGTTYNYPGLFPKVKAGFVFNGTAMKGTKAKPDSTGLLAPVSMTSSLFCKTGYMFNLGPNIKVKMNSIQLQAFQSTKAPCSGQYGCFRQPFALCSGDIRKTDLIPIIVGGCLAGVVLIVTIGYLIGSARKKPNTVDVDANGYGDGIKTIPEPYPATPSPLDEKTEKL